MKIGVQQQVRTAMTVMRSNIKIFKIQNGGRSLLESIRNAITVGRGRENENSQRTFKAIQGPGHTVGEAFLRNPGHWNFTQA